MLADEGEIETERAPLTVTLELLDSMVFGVEALSVTLTYTLCTPTESAVGV
jgi:hypothetical protein